MKTFKCRVGAAVAAFFYCGLVAQAAQPAFQSQQFEKTLVHSGQCTGAFGQPSWKCTAIDVPVWIKTPKAGALDRRAFVLVSHGSEGMTIRHNNYADQLIANGLSVAVIDHWSPRGVALAHLDFEKARISGGDPINMTIDALATGTMLRKRPEYADFKFGFMGQSMGASAAIWALKWFAYDAAAQVIGEKPKDFDALVGISAGFLQRIAKERFKDIPILFISGELDDDTPAAPMKELVTWMAPRGNPHAEIVVLPGEWHDFDGPYAWGYWPKAGSTSKCQVEVKPDEQVYESVETKKTYPLTSAGWVQFRNACATFGVHSGSLKGQQRLGFDLWTKFLIDRLAAQ